jgi:hypothetical protein
MIIRASAILVSFFTLTAEASSMSDAWMKMRYFQKSGSANVVDLSWEVRRDHSMILNLPSAESAGLMQSARSDRCAPIGGRFVRRLNPKDHDRLARSLLAAIDEQELKKPKAGSMEKSPAPTGYFKLEVFESGKLKSASVIDRHQPAVTAALELIEKLYSGLFQSRAQVVELSVRQRTPLQIELRNVGKLSVLIPIPDQPGDAFRLSDQQGNRIEARWVDRPRFDSIELQPGQKVLLQLAVSRPESSKINEIRFETRPIQHHLPRGRISPELSLCTKLK